VFWPLKSSSKILGVSEDSKFPLLGVWVSSSHLPQNEVTIDKFMKIELKHHFKINHNVYTYTKVINQMNKSKHWLRTLALIHNFYITITLIYYILHHIKTFKKAKAKDVATLAFGLRPTQGGCEVAGLEVDPGVTSHAPGSAKSPESVREWTLTLPSELLCWELVRVGVPKGLPKLQRAFWGVKTQRLGALFISMESSWSVDV